MKYYYLLFSGGKDSAACLEILTQAGLLKNTKLLFVRSNLCLPEQVNYVRGVAERTAGLVEVVSDAEAFINEHGLPSDVVHVDYTLFGSKFSGNEVVMCDRFECCGANLWKPLSDAVAALTDCEAVVIGDKLADKRHNMSYTMQTAGGVVPVLHPVYFWDDDKVRKFLRDNHLWVPRFSMSHSSIDCWRCTAYWESFEERVKYVEGFSEESGAKLRGDMEKLRKVIKISKE